MIIATETKSNSQLEGVYSKEVLESWIASLFDEDFISQFGEPDIVIADAVKQQQAKEWVRQQINVHAGDVETLLGTTADTVQMLLVLNCQLLQAISATKAADTKALREAMQPWQPLAEKLLAAMQAGQVKMPYQSKDMSQVVGAIAHSATAVASVIDQVKQKSQHVEEAEA